MKRGKIAVITACAVVLILGGIIALSRVFESSWQQESTVDNSLDAEIVDSNESVFNYPYVSRQQAVDDGYSPAYETLECAEQGGSVYKDYMTDIQTAVNTAGENVKYLTGFTAHQTIPVMAQLINGIFTEDGIYWITFYNYLLYDTSEPIGSDYVRSYDAFVDAVSGKVITLSIWYSFGDNMYQFPEGKTKIDTEKEQQIRSYAKDVIQLLDNSTGEISEFSAELEIDRNNYGRYNVNFVYNGMAVSATFLEPFDNSVLYLEGITIEYGDS